MKFTQKQNEIYENIINSTDNVIVSGPAGSGKSQIIKKLKEFYNTTVLAPTGIASLNINGLTIHANYQIDPDIKNLEIYKIKNKNKNLSFSKSPKVIIIDEISMVTDYLFDMIYYINYEFTKNEFRFILFGDFYQLPPVDGKFIFDSQYWRNCNFRKYYLEDNLRIKDKCSEDSKFKEYLYDLRLGVAFNDCAEFLENYSADISILDDENYKDYMVIFSTNKEKNNLNMKRYKTIDEEEHIFYAESNGVEKELKNIKKIVQEELKFKIGCRVMNLANKKCDTYDNKNGIKVVNGELGTIVSITSDAVYVDFDEHEPVCKITTHKWESYKYIKKIKDDEEKFIELLKNEEYIAIVEEHENYVKLLIAEYIQIPLSLAWASTIHKVQGLSINNLIVDVSNLWQFGQFYTALSRATNVSNLRLINYDKNKLIYNQRLADPYIKTYYTQESTTYPFFKIIYNNNEYYSRIDEKFAIGNESFLVQLKESENGQIKIGDKVYLCYTCYITIDGEKYYIFLNKKNKTLNLTIIMDFD